MAGPLRVLVVDDEVALVGVIAGYLEREGFSVAKAYDGPDAIAQARNDPPDLIVLDIMLPGIDGIEVCRQLRTFTDVYIVMLTARDDEVDKVVGLSVGADDYIVKPFSPRELIARVRAMLRRPRTAVGPAGTEPAATQPAATQPVSAGPEIAGGAEEPLGAEELRFADVLIDQQARRVSRGGVAIELTRTEFDLLAALAAHPKAVLSRRQLLDHVWGDGWFGDEHVVDVHIAHLRAKLGDQADAPTCIRTVRGVGYGLGSA